MFVLRKCVNLAIPIANIEKQLYLCSDVLIKKVLIPSVLNRATEPPSGDSRSHALDGSVII